MHNVFENEQNLQIREPSYQNKIYIIHTRTLLIRDKTQNSTGQGITYIMRDDMTQRWYTAEFLKLDLTLISMKENCWTVLILEYCVQALIFIFSRVTTFAYSFWNWIGWKIKMKQMKSSNVHEKIDQPYNFMNWITISNQKNKLYLYGTKRRLSVVKHRWVQFIISFVINYGQREMNRQWYTDGDKYKIFRGEMWLIKSIKAVTEAIYYCSIIFIYMPVISIT